MNFDGDFPWKRKFTNVDQIIARIKNLQEYSPKFVYGEYYKLSGKVKSYLYYGFEIRNFLNSENSLKSEIKNSGIGDYAILEHSPDDYLKYNEISDYFVEPVRAKARRRNMRENMLEYWNSHKKEIQAITDDIHEQRELIWKRYKEVGTFRPTNLAAMIKLFKATSILDFSAGWGDRLIAAMAMNVDSYIGIDPNLDLHPCYSEIKLFTSEWSKTDVIMIPKPFQNVVDSDLPKNYQCDLVFTSPPYFDLEIYTDAKTQSHQLGSRWYEDFLMASIRKAWQYLCSGGHMILVITDIPGSSYVSRMINDTTLLDGACFLGCIAYAERLDKGWRNPQPMWIWRKS